LSLAQTCGPGLDIADTVASCTYSDARHCVDGPASLLLQDTRCCVWAAAGEFVRMVQGHVGRGAWSMAVSPAHDVVATGGGDSGIRLWSMNSLVACDAGKRPLRCARLSIKSYFADPERFWCIMALVGCVTGVTNQLEQMREPGRC
jgi:hypothetical protein